MGTEKRERQKAGRQQRIEEARQAERRAGARRRAIGFGILIAVVFGGAYLFSVLQDDDGGGDEAATTTTAASGVPVTITIPPPGESVTGETECPPVDGSAERTTSFENPPPDCLTPGATYRAEVATSKGAFTIELDSENAPVTANNFITLARYKYYDGVAFHRVVPGFVVQGGDAVGPSPGTGGPGYAIDDELPEAVESENTYPVGAVAMANSGPNTSGSQFFVVSGPDGGNLGPDFSLFGTVTDGLDTIEAIDAIGIPGSDAPSEEVVIASVTITES